MSLLALLLLASAAAGDTRAWTLLEPAARPDRPPAGKPAKGVFLVASESLGDPTFARTVVLLLDYGETGALGLVVNRPTTMPLASMLPGEADLEGRDDRVFIGGPVSRGQMFLLVRSASRPPRSERILDGVYASTSLETLRELLEAKPDPASFRTYAGYSGWGPGQLDTELARGDWIVAPADPATVFEKDADTIWSDLIRKHQGHWVYRGGGERPVRATHLARVQPEG